MASVGCGGLGFRSAHHRTAPKIICNSTSNIITNIFCFSFRVDGRLASGEPPSVMNYGAIKPEKSSEKFHPRPVVTYFIRSEQNKIDWIFALSNKKHRETGKAAKTRDKFDWGKLPRLKIYAIWKKWKKRNTSDRLHLNRNREMRSERLILC